MVDRLALVGKNAWLNSYKTSHIGWQHGTNTKACRPLDHFELPVVMALKLELEWQHLQSQLTAKDLVAHVGQLHQKQHPGHGPGGSSYHYPAWMMDPPAPDRLAKMHENKQYNWCSKCRHGKGLWVLCHTTNKHVNGYRRQPKWPSTQDHGRDANWLKHETNQPKILYTLAASQRTSPLSLRLNCRWQIT